MIKPVIGIGTDVLQVDGERERAFAYLTYVDALRAAGAIPLLIPPQPENAVALTCSLDGILLAGGADCDPALYGEAAHPSVEPLDPRRQTNELALVRAAHAAGIPTLGVCLGVQLMNVASGGSLIQDIDTHHPTDIRHASDPGARARHEVRIEAGTRLGAILPALDATVNSSHHQAIGRMGEGLRVAAVAPDGIVEAIEAPGHPFFIGVQWHPEDMKGEGSAESLFRAFVEAARLHAAAKTPATVLSPAGAGDSE